jgi:2-iminobutanoate/2-iminopropanoate deaminase
MPRRYAIHTAGVSHSNPIPNACRISNLIASGAIGGADASTGGGTTDDIIKLTVFLRDRADRAALNVEWLKMFPDAKSHPARHAQQLPDGGNLLVQCDFMAVINTA